jgi:peptide/nickel transport system permease protein
VQPEAEDGGVSAPAVAAPTEAVERIDPARRSAAWRAVAGTTEGRVGLGLGAVMLAIVAFGRFVAPYSPTATGVGPSAEGPSRDHLLGTDELGMDVLSRVLTGGDKIVLIAFTAVTLAYLVGGAIGMLGAYTGGTLDTAIIRLFDFLVSLPSLLLILVIIGALGNSTLVLVLTVAFVYIPLAGRTMRGAAQAVVTTDYVAAAQARGEPRRWILGREVLPNIGAPIIADYGLRLTYGIVTVATLNFLGLGVQPPTPDWGLMVSESRTIITLQTLAVIAPIVAIAALAVSVNLIADAIARHLTHEDAREVMRL